MLTDLEFEILELAGELWNKLAPLCHEQTAREMANAIHTIQNAVLAQCAARTYPGRSRLLNGEFYG